MMNDDTRPKQKQGFVKLMRSPFTIELLRDLLAFGLLALIAFRARWRSGFNTDGLRIGEALIGDYKNCGMTRWQYRERLARLVKWGLITIHPTRKGTVARLASATVFDIGLTTNESRQKPSKNQPSTPPTDSRVKTASRPPSKPPTDRQLTANRPPLTKNDKKERRKDDDTRTRGTLNAVHAATKSSSSDSVSNLKEAENHPFWPQFENYCKSQGGAPTLKGFNTWLPKQSRNGASKTSKSMPAYKRNRIINRLNERKVQIMRTFPKGNFAPWAKEELAGIRNQLERL
jgi:hypothetical protein